MIYSSNSLICLSHEVLVQYLIRAEGSSRPHKSSVLPGTTSLHNNKRPRSSGAASRPQIPHIHKHPTPRQFFRLPTSNMSTRKKIIPLHSPHHSNRDPVVRSHYSIPSRRSTYSVRPPHSTCHNTPLPFEKFQQELR